MKNDRLAVRDVMVRDVATCYPDSTLEDAARIMWERDCGFVPIVESPESRKVVGVVTDRDVCMAAYTRGAALKDLRAADAMARIVWTCKPDDSLELAERCMSEARVRRLPIVDESGDLVGVLSLADIARAAFNERTRAAPKVDQAEVGAVVASVSHPREIAASAGA